MLNNTQSIPVERLEGMSLEDFNKREVLNRNLLK
jgi:hypothetical protein